MSASYNLQKQPYGHSVSAPAALLPGKKLSEPWRVGELRFIIPVGSEEMALQSLSPKEGFLKAFMGWFSWVHAWGQTTVRTGKAIDAEASL